MSRYTTTIKDICEMYANIDRQNIKSPKALINYSVRKIFDFPVNIGRPNTNELLCKLLLHYYTREICAETIGLWKLFLEDKVNEISEMYKLMYSAEKLQFEYDYTKKVIEKETRKTTTEKKENYTNTTDNENNSSELGAFSDTPEGTLTGVDELSYLSTAQKTQSKTKENSTNTNTGETTDNGEENATREIKNIDTISSELLTKYIENLVNIDKKFISEFEELFMMIY